MKKKGVNNFYDKEIYHLGTRLSLIFIFIAILGFFILLLPVFFEDYDYNKLGSLGDITGGFLNPIIAIAAALLTFLAFYVQYQANQQVEKQFDFQREENSQNLEYKNYKERIDLIVNEVSNFNVSFYKGKLITNLNNLPAEFSGKDNFNGVQALNLFLIEYFRDRKEKEGIDEFNLDDTYHSTVVAIMNLVILFHNLYENIKSSNLPESYKIELNELMHYLYVSKINYLVFQFFKNNPADKLKGFLETLMTDFESNKK